MSTSHIPSVSPVFVVGVFRSGTSLLYSLLNQHPQIALMYECDVWDFPSAFSGRRLAGQWLERLEFYNQALSRHRLILGGSLRGLENVRTPDDLYACHSAHKGDALWGEKSVLYPVRLVRLARHYPGGSFVLVWRDPAEIYRSVKTAGKKSAFFRRPGMLYRLIYQQERMIREAAELERAGVRIHHVSYDNLVDSTAEVCRGICAFLELDFDPRMAALEQADFSAVYNAPQHDYLRKGIIGRQPSTNKMVESVVVQKLNRFRKRWERLARRPFGSKAIPDQTPEPHVGELCLHKAVGATLHVVDGFKRSSFEFLPLPWLRTYRLFKNWLFTRDGAANKTSFVSEFRQHAVTVVVGFLLLALVGLFDCLTGPNVSCGPLYLIPCMVLALVVGRKWATVGVLACTFSITLFREGSAHHYHAWLTVTAIWNMAMRFAFYEAFVLLLDRIRRDFNPQNNG